MLLTSFLGTLLAMHATLVMVAEIEPGLRKWVVENAMALNGGAIALTLAGIVVQVIVSREAKVEEAAEEEPVKVAKKSWWKLAA
jgi:hypothetical protein